MESSVSTPHCSLVVYLDRDTNLLEVYLQDLRSFFAKFPIQYEVVVVAERGIQTPALAEPARCIQNETRRGRAASLWQGLQDSRGSFAVVTSLEMSTPLGDLFKLLQHMMTEPEVDLYWGDRSQKKGSPFLQSKLPRHKTENTFNRILREKFPGSPRDLLSDVLMFKRTSLQRLAPEVAKKKLQGWYLGPQLLKSLRTLQFKIEETAVFESGVTPLGYSLWRERWNLFKESIL